jgi:hypothetical protein
MKKQIMKTVRRIRHLRLHLGMWIAVAAIIITALHTSADMIYAIYGAQPAFAEAGSNTLREAREFETHTGHAQISMVRRNYIGGS